VALGGTESRTHVRWGRNKAPKPSSHLIELFVGPLLVVDVVPVLSTDNNVIEGSHAPKRSTIRRCSLSGNVGAEIFSTRRRSSAITDR